MTDADVSNAAFPFGTRREIMIAGAPVRALRITYVGELGWELHVPDGMRARRSMSGCMAAGRSHGIVNAGYRAIESLRLEKGYRAWGSDIGPDHTPLEAGLGWAVKLKTATVPSSAARRSRRSGRAAEEAPRGFTVDDPDVVLLGRETIFRDGDRSDGSPAAAGATRSAAISASAMSATQRGSPTIICGPAATSWRWRPSESRPTSSWSRSTTRRMRA